ncbi:uncharacterized protein TNCV_473951 [Trichonephila clavipes]|nr:uncharacterized protein TNCV_473951 [Trichonephila clavipes]
MDKKISPPTNNCGIVTKPGMEVYVGEICKRLEMQRDCALCIVSRGRLTSFSVEYKTADKAWLHSYDQTIKQQISEWKHQSSPTFKKAKTVKLAGKVMTIIFYYEGIVYQQVVDPGSTVIDSYYTNVLRTMVQHVKR